MASTGEAAWRLGRRPALDGLRGIAVLLVLVNHAFGNDLFRLGQVGVSVFFTLSGFLIATLLCDEHASAGRIDFRAFYLRRARRLLPAMVACVAVCALVGAVVGAWFTTPGQAVAALGYATNWVSIADDPQGALAHTWSLAIEEQFYLVWPVLFALLAGRRRGMLWLAGIAAVAVAGSFVLRMTLLSGGLWRIAFGSDTRAGEVLVGVLLALVLRRAHRVAGWSWATPVGVGACVAVAFAPIGWAMTWGLLLVPAATCLVILGCVGDDESGWLRSRPLVWLGRRSYGVYLWHHPVAVVVARVAISDAERLVIVATVGLVLAELSWRYIEQPFTRRRTKATTVTAASPVLQTA